MNKIWCPFLLFTILIVQWTTVQGQTNKNYDLLLTDLIDTTTEAGKNMLHISNKYGNIGISGYFQPQFQWTETKGAPSFGGGNFDPNSNNRFRIRRGRFRIDYTNKNEAGQPISYFVLQFDGTERGVNIRDFWGRIYENKWNLFSLSVGMMARPFGNEVLRSSSIRESPERGRMSQIIMNTERDLGVNITFNPRRSSSQYQWLQVDAGIYNGQGLAGGIEYDSYKDFIGRVSAKNLQLGSKTLLSMGASTLIGFIDSPTDSVFSLNHGSMQLEQNSDGQFPLSRNYYGVDAQLVIPNRQGLTQLRGEWIQGTQVGTAFNSETPRTLYYSGTELPTPLYSRSFNGAYFYYLQHLGSWQHQALIKYDFYDPQSKVKGADMTLEDGFTHADLKYSTLGFGYIYYVNDRFKITIYYDKIWKEKNTLYDPYQSLKEDLFTCRLQFSF